MRWFRTIAGFVRMLVAAFVIAQFAGVVSSPLASAHTFADAVASHNHHEHAQHHGHHDGAADQVDRSEDRIDACCALHAYFAGVLPAPIHVEPLVLTAQRLAAPLTDDSIGITPGRLDRPPKPLL
jgi:hypothetical protein